MEDLALILLDELVVKEMLEEILVLHPSAVKVRRRSGLCLLDCTPAVVPASANSCLLLA